ncbi:TPA: hypothetical protein ACH3X1_013292 [Trebouxia sp. C0004]
MHNPRQIHASAQGRCKRDNREICLPLNFNPDLKCYFNMYVADALFGANLDAYSVTWTGASQVNPEYEAVVMEKAMRWAILSAEEAAEPVLTATHFATNTPATARSVGLASGHLISRR